MVQEINEEILHVLIFSFIQRTFNTFNMLIHLEYRYGYIQVYYISMKYVLYTRGKKVIVNDIVSY